MSAPDPEPPRAADHSVTITAAVAGGCCLLVLGVLAALFALVYTVATVLGGLSGGGFS